MTSVSTRTPEFVAEVIKYANEAGSQKAAARFKVPGGTVRRWVEEGGKMGMRVPQTDLLMELSALVIRFGPQISYTEYERQVKHPGAFRQHWRSWVDFRFEAAAACPLAREYNVRRFIELPDGLMLIASDLHYWPYWGPSTVHRGLCHLARTLKPAVVVLNGDVPDFPQISLHRPTAFKKLPTVEEERQEVLARVNEIKAASPGAEHYWNWGNHCIRFDNRIAEKLPDLNGVPGTRLTHHFPTWRFQNALRVNDDQLEIKHRWKGGAHATHNNVKDAGMSYATGHDHHAIVVPYTDLRGQRYGINTGMGAEPWGPQFEYAENNPANWQGAVAALTFKGGILMPPELAMARAPGTLFFRGEDIDV